MSGTFTVPTQASAGVPNPPVGYYRFYVGDGSDNTLGAYYKKDSTGQVSSIVPVPYTDEQAQDAVAAMLTSDGTVILNYNDAGNAESVGRAALSGDVVVPAGSNAAVIQPNKVVNSMLAQMGATTVKGNATGAAANVADLSMTQLKAMLALASGDVGDFTEAAQDAVAAMLVSDGTLTVTYNDAGNTESLIRAAISGDVTIPAGSNTATIGNNKVTNAMLAQMAATTIKGNSGGAAANAQDLTPAQAKAMMALVSGDLSDFVEAAQDAVGALLANSPTITVNYNDAGNAETMAVVTTALDMATATLRGVQSPADKARSDNWYNRSFFNVLDNGIVAGSAAAAAANLTAWNTLMANIPDNSTVWFPPGPNVFFFSGTCAIPAGKHLTVMGAGNQKSIIATTSATADIFTVGDWYNTFSGLKFTSSVTRTAGCAINSGNNVAINVYDCDFASMWDGILYTGGANAGNLATVFNCNWTGTLNRGLVLDGQNANTIITGCVMDGASGVCQANLALLQCGSVIVSQCDFIRAVNNLLLAPSASLGVFSAYFVNVFFDTSPASSVKFAGTGNVQRIKFVNCWASGSATGFEFASTAPTLPTAIDFVNCDIFGNSSRGIYANGVQDFSASNCRIAGNATAGVEVTPSAGSVTKINLQNNTIAPTAGFGANGSGVILNAGTYGSVIITGNNVAGNTTAGIIDNASVATPDLKQISNNAGRMMQGLMSSFPAAVSTSGATETLLYAARIPANGVSVGDTFRIKMAGLSSSIGTLIFRVRVGTAGTVADAVAWLSTTSAAQTANAHAQVDLLLTVRSLGTGGSVICDGFATAGAVVLPTAVAAAAPAAVNTTVPWFIDVTATCSSGAFVAQVLAVDSL